MWPQATATTERAAVIPGLAVLQELVIWPKLFRRLAPYFTQGHTDFAALDGWLRADPRNRDDRLLLPHLELGNMHDMIAWKKAPAFASRMHPRMWSSCRTTTSSSNR